MIRCTHFTNNSSKKKLVEVHEKLEESIPAHTGWSYIDEYTIASMGKNKCIYCNHPAGRILDISLLKSHE